VQVDVGVRTFEEAMLVPIRLSNPQHIARRFECRDIRWLVCGVSHYEKDGDNRFGNEPWHGS